MAVEVSGLNLDCHKCDNILRKENGCTGKALRAWWIDGKLYDRCPLRLVTSTSWALLIAYRLFKKGHLPHGKGWLRESEKFNNAMIVIDNKLNEGK